MTKEEFIDGLHHPVSPESAIACREYNLKRLSTFLSQAIAEHKQKERFIKPTDKQLIEIMILFNNGKFQKSKLTDMLSAAEFIIDRLYENGDVSKKSSKEHPTPYQPRKEEGDEDKYNFQMV